MAARTANSVKEELAKKAESTAGTNKLKRSMSIADLIKAMAPEIKKALLEPAYRFQQSSEEINRMLFPASWQNLLCSGRLHRAR